jgi:DNA-binding NarL/FixJ family response regulator
LEGSDLVEQIFLAHARVTVKALDVRVLRRFAWGRTTQDIAKELHVSEGVVRNAFSRWCKRYGVKKRREALARARAEGLVKADELGVDASG